MTVIRNNSISGINSITAQSSSLNFYDSTGNTLSIGASVSGNITGDVTGNLTGNVTVATGATISGSTNTIVASTNGSERVRIHTSGKVGINTDDFARDYILTIAESSSAGTIAGILINDTDGKEFSIRSSSNGLRFRDVTSGNDRLVIDTNGNLVFPTSGQGIDFSATGDAGGMSSELLDDYEEGTWTPVLKDNSGNEATMTVQQGFYTKTGNIVNAWFQVAWSSLGSLTGNVRIEGWPVRSKANSSNYYYIGATISNQTTVGCIAMAGNGTVANMQPLTGPSSNQTGSNLSSSGRMMCSLTYPT